MVIKHFAFFTIFSVSVFCPYISVSAYGFGFEQKYWQIDEFGE